MTVRSPCAITYSPTSYSDEYNFSVNGTTNAAAYSNKPAIPYSQWINMPVFSSEDLDIVIAKPVYHRILCSKTH